MMKRVGIRLIALLLIIGGIVGVVLTVMSWLRLSATSPVTGLFIVVFACSAWAGLSLWKETPSGYRWAKILFGLQIPTITVPGFAYQFYTATILGVAFSKQAESKLAFEFLLGSSLTIERSPEITGWILGINVFAIGALTYLIKASAEVPRIGDVNTQQPSSRQEKS